MAAMEAGSRTPHTLLLNHATAFVITAMRYNSKWAVVARGYYEEDRNEPSKYDADFRALRSEIFKYQDWTDVDPMIYLTPFLNLIKASDVSGPITGAAAVALQRILTSNLLTPTTRNAEAAINHIVEDATQCKFESTNNSSDEIVLLNIVQLLGQAVDSPVGMLLSDESICKAVQAAFMLGDPVTKPKEYGDIMSYYSRQTCGNMVRTVFRNVAQQLFEEHADTIEAPKAPTMPRYGVRAAVNILEFLIDLLLKGNNFQGSTKETVEETIVFSLEMVHAVLTCSGGALVLSETLARLVQVDLMYAMSQAVVQYSTVSVITGFSQVLLAICSCMGNICMVQVETVLQRVLLRLADGKGLGQTIEQQEAALEGVLDLVRQPGFIHDMFVNCDCRLERANLFQEVASLITKTAFPVNKSSVGPLNSISLEALLAVLQALAASTKSGVPLLPSATPATDLPFYVDLWGPLAAGQHPDLAALADALLPDCSKLPPAAAAAAAAAGQEAASAAEEAKGSAADGGAANGVDASNRGQPNGDASAAAAGAPAAVTAMVTAQGPVELRCAMAEWCLKSRISLAVELFNKDTKKGFLALQAGKLLPPVVPTGDEETDKAAQDLLATRLGHFLLTCPGLSKTAIGELLGEPDPFYLKVLEAFTQGFDFATVKFDSAIRMFLESFRLPGEAQKIDRIINSFGRHFYAANEDVFRNADAAYVLAYSVIMLNTDQHNSQVKNKMTLESFQRNLRGCNEGTDFDKRFLEEVYYSIVRTPLRLDEASSMDISEQAFQQLAQASNTQRGMVVPADQGHHIFDSTMFQLIWTPAVHAMCAIVDNVSNEHLIATALDGLQLACHIAAAHNLDDVADSIIINLSKLPLQAMAQVPVSVRPDVAFGRDAKARLVTRSIAAIVNRHGDNVRGGWTNVMDVLVQLYRRNLLPDPFCRALNGDGDGGLVVRDGECSSLKTRRAALQRAAAANSGSTSIFRHISSLSSILTLGGPDTSASTDAARNAVVDINAGLNEAERAALGAAEECLASSSFEDVFMDSKFLKEKSLEHLVNAICAAGGVIPRPPGNSNSSNALPWDATELCLELLFTVLLRNRDRITLLWPRAYEHFATIFQNSRECDIVLVQKAIMAMMRLCQRLLPYKAADISEPLMRGIQLMSLVDEQVAADLAPTVASEIQSLLQGAAAYIHNQQAWMSISALIKVIHLDPASFPVCLDTISWVVKESLTMLNYHTVVSTAVDLLERAVPDLRRGERPGHPQHIAQALRLIQSAEEWLELWWISSQAKHAPEALERLGFLAFRTDSWHLLIGWLCRLSKNHNVEVRNGAMACLQRTVVAAERLAVPATGLSRSLTELLLPLGHDLIKLIHTNNKDMQQCDVTVRELVRALSKMVLLYHPQLEALQGFGTLWRGILDCLAAAAAANRGGEVLTDALPEALKNMLLVLQSKGTLAEGWQDPSGANLWEYTWKQVAKVDPAMTSQSLIRGG